MKKFATKVLALVMVCVCLASCGAVTLESMFNSKAGQQQIESMKSSVMNGFEDVYKDFEVKAEGNNLIYNYYFTSDYDAMKDQLKSSLPDSMNWENEISKLKDEIEKTSKIRPESVTYAYFTSTGEEIFSVTK